MKLTFEPKSIILLRCYNLLLTSFIVFQALVVSGQKTNQSSFSSNNNSEASSILACNTIGHWELNGDGADVSGNNLTASPVGSPTYSSGQLGQATQLNGTNQYYNLGNPSDLQITGDMTIAMWVKPSNFSARRNPWAKAYGGEGTITQETSGQLNFYWGTAGGNTGPYSSLGSGTALTLNSWNHIAIVKDYTNGSVKWYINGVQTNSKVLSMGTTASALSAYIGDGYVSAYAGSIDDVRVYDCALTTSEVVELHQMINEICNNNIDDDGDGLTDEYDPDCGVVCYNDCTVPYNFDWSDNSGTGSVWEITNGQSNLTRVYPISGPMGTYNVSVTLSNPDGQNIDFSNCGTAGNHFYTATCNDPNASVDCDGDPGTTDGQFNYGCNFLTFGITSDNSDQKTSITYEFEYPSQICNLEIGDIDFRGSGSPILESWQDEIDIVADSMGFPIAVNAIVGSKINVSNNNTDSINIASIYDTSITEGDLDPYDTDGHAIITTLGKVTSITFTYSNGPDDEGQSDDHAIRINGFEFCPTPQEICGNSLDDDNDGAIDSDDPDCFACSNGLLTNPGFEDDLTGWSNYGNATIDVDISGNKFAKISGGAGGFGQQISTNPGDDVTLTFFGKVVGAIQFVAGISFYDSGGNLIGIEHTSTVNASTFNSFSVNVIAPSGAAFVKAFTYKDDVSGEAILDGFCLTKTSSVDCNLLPNPEFDNGISSWALSTTSPATGIYSLDNTSQLSGANSAFIDVTNSTGTNWHLQFKSGPYSIDVTKNYNISFEAKATANKVINVSLQQSGSPYTTYYYSSAFSVTTTAQTFSIPNISVNATAIDALLKFYVGVNDADIWIDNIVLEEIGCTPLVPEFDNEVCYFISDGVDSPTEIQDTFFTFNYLTSVVTPIGPTGTYSIESMAMDTVNKIIYAVDGDELGTINPNNGLFNFISSDIGSLNGSEGLIDMNDIDGMSYDHVNNIIWATERRDNGSGNGLLDDLLLQIDPNTGLGIQDAFGAGIGYLVVNTPENDIDDIALADDGTLYAISNYGGSGNQAFGYINKTTGVWTEMGDYGIEDVESLAFTGSGQLIATTGKDGAQSNELYTIDAGTGIATFVGSILPGNDVEACDCISAELINLQIGDKVWADINSNGIQDVEEPGVSNVTVNLLNGTGNPYLDKLGSPVTTTTDAFGIYNFDELGEGQYIVEFVLPGGGESFTSQGSGSDDDLDSDANTSTGRSHIITLAGSVNDYSVDAGLLNANVTVRDCSNAGELFVADNNGNILRYDSNTGTLIDNFIQGLNGPIEMVVGSDDWLYISNSLNDEIRKYSLKTGVLIETIETGVKDPHGLTVGPDDNIYINNDDYDEILKLDVATGNTSVFVTGASGGLDGNKWGIEFGPDGNLYVASFYTDEILRYNGTTGAFIDVFVAANTSYVNAPSDLTFGPDGHLYVAAKYNDKVVKYNGATGAFMSTFVTYQLGGIQDPVSLEFGDDGLLYVSSQTNNIGVLRYNGTTGAYVDNFAAAPSPNGLLFAPVPDCDDCPLINVIGANVICDGETIVLSSSVSGGTGTCTYQWESSSDSINWTPISGANNATLSISSLVSDTYYRIVYACSQIVGCEFTYSIAHLVVANSDINLVIDYNNSPCLESNSTISAEASGGSGNYTYSWTGPNSFIASTDTISIVDDGNYYVTVSDEHGCQASTSGFVYEAYEPFIFTLNTTICEGESVDLSVNSSTAVGFLWGANAGNATTQAVTVTPAPPSTTYLVTVTNNVGCETTASATINVNEKTDVEITGPATICVGETSQLSPNSGGNWISTNPSVAVVSNSGVITAVDQGTATFVFTDSSNNCDSDPSASLTVLPKPTVSVTGPTTVCEGSTTTLSPTTGGTWSSSNTAVATVTNSGIVTGVSSGTASFTFTNNTTNCSSDETTSITIFPTPTTNYTGNDSICIGGSSSLSPNNNGTWTSLDPTIASINNNGGIIGLSAGTARFLFTNSITNCVSDTTLPLTVMPDPVVSVTGSTSICISSTTALSPSTGGTWVSNNPSVASVNNMGIVTGISEGAASFVFTSFLGCSSPDTENVTVDNNQGASISGDNSGCIGSNIQLTASQGGGTWTSNHPAIATVNSSGLVTPITAGTVEIKYEDNSGACANEATFIIVFGDTPIVNITGSDSICVGGITTLSPSSGGTWVSSNPNVASVSNDGNVIGVGGGIANFTFTNSTTGCVSAATDDVRVSPQLGVTIDFNGSICLEDTTQLTANVTGGTQPYIYDWDGPSGFDSNVPLIDIDNDGNYYVTVSDAFGCTVNTSGFVYEAYEPFIFGLNTTVCEGESVNLEVNSATAVAFQWNSNAGNATTSIVSVTPAPPSTEYVVTVTNDIGCFTSANALINVTPKPNVNVTGPNQICEGETTTISPTSGGIWISNDYSVAQVSNLGVVTGISAGTTTFSFKDTVTGCWSDPTASINVTDNGSVNVTGDDSGCIGSTIQLTPSVTGGVWTSSNTSVATVDNNGLVSAISQGSVVISYDPNSSACLEVADMTIFIYNNPTVSITGPSSICEGDMTSLAPSSGGVWTSSDPLIASVNNNGIVTGIDGGNVFFSWVSNNSGCSNSTNSPVSIIDKVDVSLTGPGNICIGELTTLSPTSGGIWVSSNNAIASVSSNGIVLGKSAGTAVFSFYEMSNGCLSDETIDVVVNNKPIPTFNGPSDICLGDTTYILPGSNGTWVSDNTSVATITNQGMIIGLNPGNARFTFTENNTGCISDQSLPLTVNPKPTTYLFGQSDLCIGESISLAPTSGGTWLSLDTDIATITNSGVVTGVGVGSTAFVFTLSSTGCSSDTTTDITIHDKPIVAYNGPNTICEGTTSSMTPSVGGTWSSSNTNVATITPSGAINAISPGTTKFTFTSAATGCTNSPNQVFTVIGKPNISITGPQSICIGGLTSLSPTNGGVWTSNDESIATIDNSGTITGVSGGSTTFVFTNSTTGCTSANSTPISVYSNPTVQITGDDEICIGSTTTLSPSSGGFWSSSNNAIASITSSGVVTGISLGTATFTFVENSTGCSSVASLPVTIVEKPTVSITGPSNICVGSITTLSPDSGGTWTSNNPSVATVNAMGIVTGVSQGIAKFTFISDAGCVSNETAPITIFGKPTIFNPGDDELCVGSTITLFPMSGGTWESTNPSIATINNQGLVNGISAGNVRFYFTETATGCTSDTSNIITVNPLPMVSIIGQDSICIGNTTQLSPTSGGFWYSNDVNVAIISNTGLVTGISSGDVTFYFVKSSNSCQSENSLPITIKDKPLPQYVGPAILCEGDTTYITPASGGIWESDNPSVATIDNAGLIVAQSNGLVRFKFTEPGGCASDWSGSLTVNANPTVGFVGSDLVCVAGYGQVYPTLGGQWVSLSPSIATIDNSGLITGISAGQASFVFTSNDTGCSSDGSLTATVLDPPTVTLVGDSEICMGYTTQVTAGSIGIWTSSDDRIAMVSNAGVVTGKAPGKVMISFTDAISGCNSASNSVEITVGKCLNHDFNVTTTTLIIGGDISTNDEFSGVYMTTPTLVSKPGGSLPNLTINNDGTYTFGSSTPGKYVYDVQVCESINSIGCPTTTLEITVLGNIFSEDNPVNNLEFVTIIADSDPSVNSQTSTIDVISNDGCVKTLGCNIDNSSLQIMSTNTSGVSAVSNDKIDHYTAAGYLGMDTVTYEVCGVDPTNCSASNLYVTVSSPTANNDVNAPDDFAYTMATIAVSGNVMSNDSDPENDVISVTPQGSLGSPITIGAGAYYINSDGTYSFTPANGFTGQLELVYTLCDDNVNQACADATLHILVFGDMEVNTRVYLGGALMLNNNETASDGRPLMRDDLRLNPYDNNNYIPTTDPYSGYIGLLDMTSSFTHVGPGLLPENQVVNPTVFNVTGQDAIVDWVFLELRDKTDNTNTFATRSALLQRDGDVVELDGVSHVRFNGIGVDSFYLVVRHRSHLDVMSELIANDEVVDFTNVNTEVFNFGTNSGNGLDYTGLSMDKITKPGYSALWAGDFDANGKVKFTNPFDDQNILFAEVLFFPNNYDGKANFDFVYGYFQGDFDMNGKAKFVNPNDDKNMLFSQLLFYPLNINLQDNFNFFIEQVPTNE